MLFAKFQGGNSWKFGVSDRHILSSEYRIPDRDENEVTESTLKSGETELCHAFFRYFVF